MIRGAPVASAPAVAPSRTGPRAVRAAAVLLVALAALLPTAASAQMPQYAEGALYTRVDGDAVRAAIVIEIDAGWHLYGEELGHPEATGLPTVATLGGEGVVWGDVWFPPAEKHDQVGLDTWAWEYDGTIALYARGRLEAGASGDGITAEVDGLTCSTDGTCVPYYEELSSAGAGPDLWFDAFPAEVAEPGEGGGDAGGSAGVETPRGRPTEAVDDDVDWDAVVFPEFTPQTEPVTRGFGAWILLAFVAGMILNVMPCVLPVISIKILSFVQQAGEDRTRILQLGLAFAAGIVVVFVALAALAVNLGLSWGEQFQSQEFLVVMIGVVFAFSLSMFGVYELGVPAGVGQLAGGPPREGLGDAFFKGMLATVLATPCSGPFLGSTLTWTLGQPPTTVFAVFLSLGLGMALPYVVLTANPRLLKVVPKPGPWMDTFKHAMGFVLLLTVVYLMVSLRQDLLLFTVAFLVTVGIGCWWWGRFAPRAASKGRRLLTLLVAFAIAAGGARVSFVEFRGLFLASEDGWTAFHPDVFGEALEDGRNVFVDFTAEWCPNCKANEKLVYDDSEVRAAMSGKDVLVIKADITGHSPRTDAIERLMDGLGARSIPFMAVFPGDRPSEPVVRFDLVTKSDFLEILDTLPEPAR